MEKARPVRKLNGVTKRQKPRVKNGAGRSQGCKRHEFEEGWDISEVVGWGYHYTKDILNKTFKLNYNIPDLYFYMKGRKSYAYE